MSHSPTARASDERPAYESGWEAIYALMRKGLSWSGHERHCAFLNTGDGRFADVSAVSGLDFPDDGRAALSVDWDQDGAPDLVVGARNGPLLRVLRNRSNADWLALRLRDQARNRDGVGARIEVRLAGGELLVDSVRAGEGYLAQAGPWTHFGLGAGGRPERVRVRWPGGEWEEFSGVAGSGRFLLERGSGQARPAPPPDPCALAESVSAPGEPSTSARVVLASPVPLPQLQAATRAGAQVPLHDELAHAPTLVVLWAEWCAPCATELERLAGARAAVERSGLRVLALDVDPAADSSRLDELQWPFAAALADADLLDVLDAVQQSVFERRRRLALPTSLLLDAEGQLAVIYRGPVEVERVLADVGLFEGTAEERRAAAVPFPGRWLAPPPAADLLRAARFLRAAGHEEPARFYDRQHYERRRLSPGRIQFEFGSARARAGQLEPASVHFRAATELEPDFQEAWSSLGTALQSIGRTDEAIEAYTRALDLDGRDVAARYNLALALAGRAELPAALEQLELLRLVAPAQAEELEAVLERLGLR